MFRNIIKKIITEEISKHFNEQEEVEKLKHDTS